MFIPVDLSPVSPDEIVSLDSLLRNAVASPHVPERVRPVFGAMRAAVTAECRWRLAPVENRPPRGMEIALDHLPSREAEESLLRAIVLIAAARDNPGRPESVRAFLGDVLAELIGLRRAIETALPIVGATLAAAVVGQQAGATRDETRVLPEAVHAQVASNAPTALPFQ